MANYLFISNQLPPYRGSGNIRVLNYINHIVSEGDSVDVLTVIYPENAEAYEKELEKSFNSKVNVIRVSPGNFYKKIVKKKLKTEEKESIVNNKLGISNKLKGWLKNNLLIPDSFVIWALKSKRVGKKLLKEKKYDKIVSIHENPSSHLLAYLLVKDDPNIKWTGYWSDPWIGDDSLRSNQGILKSKVELYLEKKVCNRMDKLLFTTKATEKMYKSRYKNIKNTDIVFRGYDAKEYRSILEDSSIEITEFQNDKINIIYTGMIYDNLRDLEPLMEALSVIKKENIELYDKLNIIFVGSFDNIETKIKLSKFSCVCIIDFLPYSEAMKFIVKADVLLLYGNSIGTQVPGKVYEYAGSNALILTIYSNEEDELIDIMTDIDKGPIIENKSINIREALNEIDKLGNYNNTPCDKYRWEKVALDFKNKL